VAFDKRTGERRWAGPPRNQSYSSPAAATLAGVAQILIVNEASLSGHATADGRLLWEHPWPGTTSGDANVSQAVPLPPARVFVSKGYGGGAALLALEAQSDGGLEAREVWHDGRTLRTKLTNVVLRDGLVYGLDDGMLECVELETGAKRWKAGRYGHGQILLVGGLLLVCSEEGEVFLIEPGPERENHVLGSFQALDGKCWAHLALAGGVLLLRNAEECAAWELPLGR
jgi:outer membrane protein assembly factor BamB